MKIPKELNRYKEAKIFGNCAGKVFKPGDVLGPVTVGLEKDLLDSDDNAVLKRVPTFSCM